MSPGLLITLDWICWIAALAAIGGYVAAFLRNRPYVRPSSSLGLLLTGAALLAMPTLVGMAADEGRPGAIAYVVLALATAVVFQLIAALRRRRPRASEQGA